MNHSSVVEHPPVKRTVVGSNPAGSVLFVSHSHKTPDTNSVIF